MIRCSIRCLCAPSTKYDAWSILGVKQGIPLHVLRDRYHTLTQKYHPKFADSGQGDMKKMKEIDDAYLWITKAPVDDKRYRNLIEDSTKFYYEIMPKWMAKNLDEMPRYWNWLRWKTPSAMFCGIIMILLYIFGRLWPTHRRWVYLAAAAFALDCLLHSSVAPLVLVALVLRLCGEQSHFSIAWLTSPKNFWRRNLDY